MQVTGIDLRIGAAIAVPSAGRDAVGGEVLQAGSDALALDARSHLRAQLGDQERVFPIALHRPAPALVARHVEDGRIDAVIADQAGLVAGNLSGPSDQVTVPGAADGDRRGEGCGEGVVEAVDAFVGEFGRDSEARLLHEELLDLVQGLDVVAEGIDQVVMVLESFPHPVEVLVDVGDAVLPDPLFPFRGRESPGQDAPVAVDRHQLAGLLVDCHLREQVLHALFHAAGRVFVDVLDAVLVEVDPTFVVDGFLFTVGRQCQEDDRQGGEGFRYQFHVVIIRKKKKFRDRTTRNFFIKGGKSQSIIEKSGLRRRGNGRK